MSKKDCFTVEDMVWAILLGLALGSLIMAILVFFFILPGYCEASAYMVRDSYYILIAP